ncbi:MAG: hypothetical protein K1X83_05775 [Oligoflexia bacterium]|nr:hypothetical protein [Oligoflexia bacterium]
MSTSVKWLGFGIASALTRTAAHFYPSSGNVTAPYPVSCRLTIFAEGQAPTGLTVDGLRLSQPEGVWVDEAFPVLKSSSAALFGMEVCISCQQQRVDLENSSCVLEFASLVSSVRFWPVCTEGGPEIVGRSRVAPLIKDPFHLTSVIVINPTDQPQQPKLLLNGKPAGNSEVGAFALKEFELDSLAASQPDGQLAPQEVGFGLFRGGSLEFAGDRTPCAIYLVYRDVLTKRPVSVVSI